MQISPHCDVDMWGMFKWAVLGGLGRILTLKKLYFFGFETLVLCNFRDLIYAQSACHTPKIKQNKKSHHMTPLTFLKKVTLFVIFFTKLLLDDDVCVCVHIHITIIVFMNIVLWIFEIFQ